MISITKWSSKAKKYFGTHEWSVKSINISKGCKHDCLYCYAKGMALRFHQCKRPAYWHREKMTDKCKQVSLKKYNGIVMYPTAHDMQSEFLYEHLFMIDSLLLAGNTVMIVSKPQYSVIKSICKRYVNFKDKIIFRFTIGSLKNSILKFWEPHAPSFNERMKSLAYAYRAGYQTSVSCEPFLDKQVEKTYRKLRPFIRESFWIGKCSMIKSYISRNTNDDPEVQRRADKLLNRVYTDEYIRHLYSRLNRDPLIRWKDSCKKILGLKRATRPGLNK